MNERLKNIIFYKLYEDLKHVKIIPYNNEIWFVDRKKKYWYFIYQKDYNHLLWHYQYFNNYFGLFSLNREESEYVMSRWIEEVLNTIVETTGKMSGLQTFKVEEVLNSTNHE